MTGACEGLLLVNAPRSTITAHQYVLDSVTSGPGRFAGWDFETFEIYNGESYAGTSDGRVVSCFDGYDGFTFEAILPRQFGDDHAVISHRFREEYEQATRAHAA